MRNGPARMAALLEKDFIEHYYTKSAKFPSQIILGGSFSCFVLFSSNFVGNFMNKS